MVSYLESRIEAWSVDDRNWSFHHNSGEFNDIIEKNTLDEWIPDLESESAKKFSFFVSISVSVESVCCLLFATNWHLNKAIFFKYFFSHFFLVIQHSIRHIISILLSNLFSSNAWSSVIPVLISSIFNDIKSSRIRRKECVEKKVNKTSGFGSFWICFGAIDILTRNNQKKKK